MTLSLRVSLIAFLVVLSGCAIIATLELSALMRSIPEAISREADLTRDLLDTHLIETESKLFVEIGKINNQLELTRKDLFAETKLITQTVDARLAETNAILDRSAAEAVRLGDSATYEALARVDDALRQTGEVQARFLEREPMIYSRFLAVTGETMRTMDAWRRMSEEAAKAAPEVVESGKALAKSSVEISKHVEKTAENVAEITKPRPFWRTLVDIATSLPKALF